VEVFEGNTADPKTVAGQHPKTTSNHLKCLAYTNLRRRNFGGIEKMAWNQLLRSRAAIWARDYQHRERLGNDDDNTDTPAHFLRILSMAFPLASSSTSLSK
jgi:hypothetical protein